MKMPSLEYINLINLFGIKLKQRRDLLDDADIQKIKYEINRLVEELETAHRK